MLGPRSRHQPLDVSEDEAVPELMEGIADPANSGIDFEFTRSGDE